MNKTLDKAFKSKAANSCKKSDKQKARELAKQAHLRFEKISKSEDPAVELQRFYMKNPREARDMFEALSNSSYAAQKRTFHNIMTTKGSFRALIGNNIRTGRRGRDPADVTTDLCHKLPSAVLLKALINNDEEISLLVDIRGNQILDVIERLSMHERSVLATEAHGTIESLGRSPKFSNRLNAILSGKPHEPTINTPV